MSPCTLTWQPSDLGAVSYDHLHAAASYFYSTSHQHCCESSLQPGRALQDVLEGSDVWVVQVINSIDGHAAQLQQLLITTSCS